MTASSRKDNEAPAQSGGLPAREGESWHRSFDSELQKAAHATTEWAYSGGEGRRRAVATILADVMMAVEKGQLAEARDLMARLVVLSRWTTMSLDDVAGTLGLGQAERDEIRAGLVEGLVADGHDREHAIEIADQLAANSLWSLDIDESPPGP